VSHHQIGFYLLIILVLDILRPHEQNNQSGRPHEELVVGTAMDRSVPFPDPCIVAHDDNRELYCCGHMRCLVCYDTRDKCKAKCQSPLTICN
jgi:hypothetical protein